MFLKHTEHVGFKRFKLNPISKFTYAPKHLLTFIIGTNGAGKSSLIGEWNPEPKSAVDYKPGGHCKQIYEDNGHTYELRSEFDLKGGAKHHFIRDGVPLNNGEVGGTAKVQRELVAQYFNYDRELHKVLSGNTSFTKMTAKQRHQVITELSNCDLGWALNTFYDIQSQIRNSKGTQRDLAVTTAEDKRRLKDFHIDKVVQDQERLRGELKDLTGMLLSGVRNNVDNEREEYDRLLESCTERITHFIRSNTASIDTLGLSNETELQVALNEVDNEVRELSNVINQLSNQAAQAEETYERLQKTLALSGDALDKELEQTTKALESLPERVNHYDTHESTPSDYLLLERDLGLFITTHDSLLPLTHTEDQVAKTRLWLRSAPEVIRSLEKGINQHRSWLQHLEQHDKVNCPQCNHEFLPGLDPNEKPTKEKEIIGFQSRIDSTTANMERGQKVIDHMEAAQAQRHQLIEMFNALPEQKHLCDSIFSDGLSLGEALLKIRAVRIGYETHLNSVADRERLERELERLRAIQQQSENTNLREEIVRQKELFEKALRDVADQQDNLLVVTERQRALNALKSQFELHERVMQDALLEKQRLETLSNELVRYEVNQFIENLMNEVHEQLAKTQQIILDYNTLASNIRRLEEIEVDAKARQEAWELVANALSPQTGLIADQLKDHINVLISHMNQIISQIWEHNLEILPCGLNKGKLDYIFPVYVASDPDVTPDIAYGSKGEREVIDLAFTIVLMLQRGLSEYPLYLDEIASSFDKTHRIKFMAYLNELAANKKISQIFMINHYSDMYGIVGEHDVVVLDSTNVVLPESYNDNVFIA